MARLKVPVTPHDHIRGPEDAPVTLVEYGDYQCPYCRMAHAIVQRVGRHYGDRLRFVYRHFPLTEIHPFAEIAAQTAEFAGAHGRFWEMHDALFENQHRMSLPVLFSLASALGLSQLELRDALEAGTYLPKVQADFISGVRSGVNGTPTFFINDERHDGPFDFDTLVTAIDAHLQQAQVPA